MRQPALVLCLFLLLNTLFGCSGGDDPVDAGVMDRGGGDAPAVEAGADGAVDAGPARDGGKEAGAPDLTGVDGAAADLVQPDGAPADAAPTDQALPDAPLPDLLQPDLLQPDLLQPDLLQPDQALPPDTGPVKGKWTPVGPPVTGGTLIKDIVVDGSTIYASVSTGSKVSVRVLSGFSGSWTVVPNLQIPSSNSRIPMLLHSDGSVLLGMPDGYNAADKKVYRKARGQSAFTLSTVGFTNNYGGIADLFSAGSTVHGIAYRGLIAESQVTSQNGGQSFTVSHLDGHYPGVNSRGFASGSRLFFYGDGVLRYSDNGGVKCTTALSGNGGVLAGAADGQNVVVISGYGKNEVAYSSNNGASFTTIKPGILGSGPYEVAHVDGCFYIPNDLHMLRSCNGGASWTFIDDGAPKFSVYLDNPPQVLRGGGGYIYGFFGTQLHRYPTK